MTVRRRDIYRYGLFALLLAAMAAFLLWPIALTVQGGFGPLEGATLGDKLASVFRYFVGDTGVLHDPLYRQGMFNSLAIAAWTTVLCLLISMPLATLASRFEFRGRALLSSLVLVPLILPPFVGAIGVRALLGRFGAVNALLGHLGLVDAARGGVDFLGGGFGGPMLAVIVTEALHLYPILFLNVTAAMANLDPALDEAAAGLGAGRWRRFRRITVPLILPGIFAGATIVFIWSFTELGTPLMFDYYRVTPVQIFWGIQELSDNPRPYALVVVLLIVAVGLYLLGRVAFGRHAYAMHSKASIASVPTRLHGFKALGAAAAFACITAVAVLPHLGVVLSSLSVDGAWYRSVLPTQWTFEHYVGEQGALTHPLAVGSIRNSLVYAFSAMVLCVGVGLAISYLTVRVRVRGGWLLDSLAMLPLAVPGLVMAFGYAAMTLRWPFGEGDPLAGTLSVFGTDPNPIPLLIIAYAVRRLPYVVRSVSAGLEQTSRQLEEAALNLGASMFTTLRRIVVPLIMANLIAGGILAFSFAMLEVSDSLILAQKAEHYPITKGIYALFQRLGDGPYIASAMGVWGMALLAVTLVGAGLLLGKRLGAIFRV